MLLTELRDVLSSLAQGRPVFHSEADFQHALAWEVHCRHPDARIRLEQPVMPGLYLDLGVGLGKRVTAIELKYKTSRLNVLVDGEEFRLQNHGAEPPSRYSFIGDLARVERLVAAGEAADGFVVFLTNNPRYWNPGRDQSGDVSAAFRIHQGQRLTGTIAWAAHTAQGTMGKHSAPIILRHDYIAAWADYSRVGGQGPCVFRYLAMEVRSP